MAAYCRVDGVIHFTSPAGWLPVHRDQLRAQRSVTSMGKLYKLFFYLGGLVPERYNQSGFYWSNTVQYAFVGIVTLLKQFFSAY